MIFLSEEFANLKGSMVAPLSMNSSAKLLDISQCNKALNFEPVKNYPQSLPIYAWASYILCGFERNEGGALQLEGDLAQILYDLYPQLSAGELARLHSKFASVFGVEQARSYTEKLLSLYGVKNKQEGLEILQKLSLCPKDFQNWVQEKKILLQELHLLKMIPEDDFLSDLSQTKASKSQGFEILELWLEVFLMGQKVKINIHDNPDQIISDLKKIRYPLSSSNDKTQEQKMKTLSWPIHTQAKWVRLGDRAGVEIKFSLFSDQDFAKIIHGLEKVKSEAQSELWPKN